MNRFAIASDFEGQLGFFCGGFSDRNGSGRFNPIVDPDKAKAFTAEAACAESIALGLTELSRCLPPFEARTWFAFALAGANEPVDGLAVWQNIQAAFVQKVEKKRERTPAARKDRAP